MEQKEKYKRNTDTLTGMFLRSEGFLESTNGTKYLRFSLLSSSGVEWSVVCFGDTAEWVDVNCVPEKSCLELLGKNESIGDYEYKFKAARARIYDPEKIQAARNKAYKLDIYETKEKHKEYLQTYNRKLSEDGLCLVVREMEDGTSVTQMCHVSDTVINKQGKRVKKIDHVGTVLGWRYVSETIKNAGINYNDTKQYPKLLEQLLQEASLKEANPTLEGWLE